ncbi:hypothetical protein [Mesobacillus subterraneus]|nr:hypothetical protein [Mesobacillus subterraneus]
MTTEISRRGFLKRSSGALAVGTNALTGAARKKHKKTRSNTATIA